MAKPSMRWKIHLPNLLKEIMQGSRQGIYGIPILLLRRILAEMAERAIVLNDPQLNDFMCRLALYSVADPESPDYDLKKVHSIQRKARQARQARKRAAKIAQGNQAREQARHLRQAREAELHRQWRGEEMTKQRVSERIGEQKMMLRKYACSALSKKS